MPPASRATTPHNVFAFPTQSPQYSGSYSPFVTFFSGIGIPHAGDVIQVVVLTAALSSLNAGLYATGSSGLWPLAVLLTLFFVAFNVLEATQPSWISKIAPPHAKGTALGIYNTLQSLGLFLGGALGGWLAQHMGPGSVSLLCAGLALAWLILAAGMAPPPVRRVAAA